MQTSSVDKAKAVKIIWQGRESYNLIEEAQWFFASTEAVSFTYIDPIGIMDKAERSTDWSVIHNDATKTAGCLAYSATVKAGGKSALGRNKQGSQKMYNEAAQLPTQKDNNR